MENSEINIDDSLEKLDKILEQERKQTKEIIEKYTQSLEKLVVKMIETALHSEKQLIKNYGLDWRERLHKAFDFNLNS